MKKNDENYRMSGSKQTVNDKLQDKQIPKKNSQKRNYQKELEKVLGQVEQSENVPSLLLHKPAVPHAAAGCWSTFPSIFGLRFCILIQTLRLQKSMTGGWKSRNGWCRRCL